MHLVYSPLRWLLLSAGLLFPRLHRRGGTILGRVGVAPGQCFRLLRRERHFAPVTAAFECCFSRSGLPGAAGGRLRGAGGPGVSVRPAKMGIWREPGFLCSVG